MLHAEGDAHDGDAANQTKHKMRERYLPPAAEYPYDIHNRRKATRFACRIAQFMAERPEGKRTKLKELHAKGNADNRDAHNQTRQPIHQRDQNAAQEQP